MKRVEIEHLSINNTRSIKGVELKDGTCTWAAPGLDFMKGKSKQWIEREAKKNGWIITVGGIGMEEK